jgi:hypothetical protein
MQRKDADAPWVVSIGGFLPQPLGEFTIACPLAQESPIVVGEPFEHATETGSGRLAHPALPQFRNRYRRFRCRAALNYWRCWVLSLWRPRARTESPRKNILWSTQSRSRLSRPIPASISKFPFAKFAKGRAYLLGLSHLPAVFQARAARAGLC